MCHKDHLDPITPAWAMSEMRSLKALTWTLAVLLGITPMATPATATEAPVVTRTTERETKEAKDFKPGTSQLASGWVFVYRGGVGGLWEFPAKNNEDSGGPGEDPEAKDGYQLWGSAVLGRYTSTSVVDFGIGWSFSAISGAESMPDATGTSLRDDVTIRTQSALVDVAWRWRLTEVFEAGPMLGVLVGKDMSYASQDLNRRVAAIGGLALGFLDWNPTFTRRGYLNVWTDLTVPDRQMVWAGVALDIGFGLIGFDRDTTRRTVVERQITTTTTTVEKETDRPVAIKVLRVPLRPEAVSWRQEGDAAIPAAETVAFLERLGEGIASAEGAWRRLLILVPSAGGTDVQLATRRAAAIADIFAAKGAPKDRLRSRARPPEAAPEDGDASVSVELQFLGVTDARAIRQAVSAILTEFQIPETCRSGVCQ